MRTFWLALIAVVTAATLGLSDAEASKRLGGGKNVGKQAPSNVTQRQAMPSSPAANPAAPAAAARAGATGAAAAASTGSRWMAPLAGLAAGLGLAALASHLGFGEELASFMLMALLAVGVLVVVRMVLARRAAGSGPALAGASAGPGRPAEFTGLDRSPVQAPAARPQPVPMAAGAGASAVSPVHADLPAGFDAEGFVRSAKVHFIRMQAAFDAGDTDDLREFTSPEMFAELKMQVEERNGAANQTDVIGLQAALLGVETVGAEQIATVRFDGEIRENAGAVPESFREIWNFSRPMGTPGGWVLAGIQQVDRS